MARDERDNRPSLTGTVDLQGQIAAQRGDLDRKDAELARLKALLTEREAELLATKGNLAASNTVSVAGLEQGEGQLRNAVTLTHTVNGVTARSWARAGDVVTTRPERVSKLQEVAGQQLSVFLIDGEHFKLLANHLK